MADRTRGDCIREHEDSMEGCETASGACDCEPGIHDASTCRDHAECLYRSHLTVAAGTIGFAFAGNKFVGSVQADGSHVLYQTDLNGGNVQLFAPTVTIPGGSVSSEHFVASSLGLGGFPGRDVYVASGTSIIHINNAGTASNVLVTGLASPVRG